MTQQKEPRSMLVELFAPNSLADLAVFALKTQIKECGGVVDETYGPVPSKTLDGRQTFVFLANLDEEAEAKVRALAGCYGIFANAAIGPTIEPFGLL